LHDLRFGDGDGTAYTYERVLEDSGKYPKSTPDGKFPAWWETYLRDAGFAFRYCRSSLAQVHPDSSIWVLIPFIASDDCFDVI
jgi:hypothetical protein